MGKLIYNNHDDDGKEDFGAGLYIILLHRCVALLCRISLLNQATKFCLNK
jgi:hypothetical protein